MDIPSESLSITALLHCTTFPCCFRFGICSFLYVVQYHHNRDCTGSSRESTITLLREQRISKKYDFTNINQIMISNVRVEHIIHALNIPQSLLICRWDIWCPSAQSSTAKFRGQFWRNCINEMPNS